MATVYEAFSLNDATLISKTLGHFTVDYCKKLSDGSAVSQTGMTLTELGVGDYQLMNPNITERTICRIHLTSDATKRAVIVFDPVDGNISTVTESSPGAIEAGSTGAYANSSGIITTLANATYGLNAIHTEVAKDATVAKEDTITGANTELASVPDTTGSLKSMIQFLFSYFRNKKTVTSNTETLMKEDAATTLGTSTISDDGTTFTKGEMN